MAMELPAVCLLRMGCNVDTYRSTGSRMFCPGIDSGLSDRMDYCSAGKNSNGKVTDAW